MDAITLTAVVRELEERLLGGRVQAVVQPDEHSLSLEVFHHGERRWLLLDATAAHARVHFLPQRARRGLASDTPFLLLARKHLRGARVTRIFQPPWERVLYLRFQHREHGATTLVGEIMGRWSNLALLDERGRILDALRRFGPDENPYRTILPAAPYQPPPPPKGKQPIDLITEADLERLLNQTPAGQPLWRVLVRRISGLSPLAAREIIHRATGDAQAEPSHPNVRASALFDALSWFRNLPLQGGWAPTVALDPIDETPAAFAPYELSHLGRLKHCRAISDAAHLYYSTVIGADSYAGRRKQVRQLLANAHKKLLARRAALNEQAVSDEQVAQWRRFGEWILTYAWKITPGDRELEADTGEEILHIPLDPALSASENAQAYFARYRKAKRAAAKVPELLAEVDRDLAYIEQLQSDLELADNAPQIEEIREAALLSGLVREAAPKRRVASARTRPLRVRINNFDVFIGRNALQNDIVTWKLAQPNDMWLHVKDAPGAHVIIRSEGREVPPPVIEQAAGWAAFHSSARRDAKVAVMVTQRRHLRRLKRGRPGQVRVLRYKTITVAPLSAGQASVGDDE
ncbi:MAG: fibronectin/fibrinogen-binding protein [Chloroflexi bacterium]|nr:fibronectin/fibrinogen-binding protein [Chloroflexota bacterium]